MIYSFHEKDQQKDIYFFPKNPVDFVNNKLYFVSQEMTF